MPDGIIGGLGNLATLRDARSRRASSWDTTGGNADFWIIRSGETRTLADLRGLREFLLDHCLEEPDLRRARGDALCRDTAR